MTRKLQGFWTLLFLFSFCSMFAQDRTISGTITDDQGMPLPGVNVRIKGTSSGIQSDFDGNYSIQAQKGDIIVFSFVGLKTAEYTVADVNTIDVIMEADQAQLDEVVVTAFGISREKKSLGYAVSEVSIYLPYCGGELSSLAKYCSDAWNGTPAMGMLSPADLPRAVSVISNIAAARSASS